MSYTEPVIHSFIVKFWLDGLDDRGHDVWRGHITHVPSGRRQYLKNPGMIAGFISPYLHGESAPPPFTERVRRWWDGVTAMGRER